MAVLPMALVIRSVCVLSKDGPEWLLPRLDPPLVRKPLLYLRSGGVSTAESDVPDPTGAQDDQDEPDGEHLPVRVLVEALKKGLRKKPWKTVCLLGAAAVAPFVWGVLAVVTHFSWPLGGLASALIVWQAAREFLEEARAEHILAVALAGQPVTTRSLLEGQVKQLVGDAHDLSVDDEDSVGTPGKLVLAADLPSLESVGGYDSEKQQVLRIAQLVRAEYDQSTPESSSEMERANVVRVVGALLHGDPGVGKSLLARAAAHATGLNVIEVSSSDLRIGIVGRSGKAVKRLARLAKAVAPVLIVIDEIDDILKDRSGTEVARTTADDELAAAFLQTMTSLPPGVALIGTTNFLSRIDPASRSRFDAEIKVPMPDDDARLAIVNAALRIHTTRHDVDVQAIAAATSGLSGRKIDKIISMAASEAAITDDHAITTEDVLQELRAGTASAADLRPVPWSAVILDDDTLDQMKDVGRTVREAMPSAEPVSSGLRAKPPTGVLLYGPSGTGKTTLVKALRTDFAAAGQPVSFMSMKGSDFMGEYVNQGPKQVSAIFNEARAAAGGGMTVLAIDEAEVVFKKRDPGAMNKHAEDDKVVTAFLAEMDGMESDRRVLVIATTNHRDHIDPAILQRLSLKVHIPLPDADCRRRMLNLFLADKPVAPDLDLDALAYVSEGLSGRQIADWVEAAVSVAVRRGADRLHQQDLLAALTGALDGAA